MAIVHAKVRKLKSEKREAKKVGRFFRSDATVCFGT